MFKAKSNCIKDSVYIDDGYSGTNFNRPGITRLLKLVRDMAVDCIIVKDFSRFSRDYIELGTYIEQIFPFMGVRFISVNDGYDSADQKHMTAELDTCFKSLLYDLYSKDLSVKVKASLAARKDKGQYVSANCPFGYERDPDDRHMLRVEEDEAAIVRRIFEMTLQGYSSSSIARQLNKEGIKTPVQFKMEKGKTTRKPKKGGFIWQPAVICRILRNEVYAGDIVYGKTKKEAVGGKNRSKPQSEWRRYRNHHEPVIDRRTFEMVQKSRGGAKKQSEEKSHPLTGILVCGCCGRNLYIRRGQHPYFSCPCRYVSLREDCVRKADAALLERHVLLEMQRYAQQAADPDEVRRGQREAVREELQEWQNKSRAARKETAKLKKQKMEAYEDYSAGRTDAESYRESVSDIADREAVLAAGIAAAEQRVKMLQKEADREPETAEIMEYLGLARLTAENVSKWIEEIAVYREDKIEICWRVLH